MNIPILSLKKEYNFFKKDIQKQLKDCFESQQWILGEKLIRFEEKAAKYLGVKHAIGVASGTDALILSLRALALKLKNKDFFDKKDEIITTPFTFIATAEAIMYSGATPVFVDIDPDTFNIDPVQIENALTKNTVGILPVHLYGLACDMERISRVAGRNNLFIVEDTAQAFGGMYKDKKLGTFGDFGAYSFFPSKNLGGIGDGGLIATNNSDLDELVRVLRNHGQVEPYKADYLGFNSRLDSIQAAALLVKLKHIDKLNRLRIKTAEKYNKAFRKITQIQTPDIGDEKSAILNANYSHIYHLYTVKISLKRDKFLKHLDSQGIGARVYYPVLLNKMKVFRNAKDGGKLKNAEDISSKVLSLPMHPFLSEEEVNYVIKSVKSFF